MSEKLEPWVFRLLVGSAASVLVSIAAAETLLAAACLLWLGSRPRAIQWPIYWMPLALFALTTVISLVVSPDPSVGFGPVRKLVLFAMGLVAVNSITDPRRARIALLGLLSVATLAGSVALAQFAINYSKYLSTGALADDPMVLARITGFMGHWMTFSGEQLLVWCAGLPIVVALHLRRWVVPLSLIGVTLILSFTRSVWLGAGASLLVVAWALPSRRLIRVLIPVGLIGIVASGLIVHRLSMSLEGQFAPDRGRIAMAAVGLRMIRDHPLFGVGPERVVDEFPNYYRGAALDSFYYGHLHNNFLQIAAERGLPCLAALVWLIVALSVELVRITRCPDDGIRWFGLSALSALTGFVIAGLFEYNFGDSEVLLLFLFIVSIPLGLKGASGRAG